jgi:ligand-binding sensor domain-containing protein/two-component sensor histidine kinase
MFFHNYFIITKKLAVISLLGISLFTQAISASTNQYREDEIQFTHLTTEDGLSVNGVTKILQDSKGFLWFGTYNGLQRFDGYSFKIFLPEPSNPNSISSHSILDCYEDHKGDIWIATADGLNKFDWETEKFYRYKNNPDDPYSLSYNYVYTIFEDKSGTLWAGTLVGLNRYDRKNDNFTVIKDIYIKKYGGTSSAVKSICEDKNGNLWLGTWSGLINIQKNGKLIKQYLENEKNPKTIGHREITTLFADNSNNLWIGTNGKGIEVYNPKTGIFKRLRSIPNDKNTVSNDFINTIYQDKLNNIWIGTKNGLNKYDAKKNTFTRIFHSQFNTYSLINDDIFSVIEDKTGTIWIGTAGGLSKFHQTKNNFRKYEFYGKYLGRTLDDERVNYLYRDRKENLWIGTKVGLYKIEANEKSIEHFYSDPSNSNSLSNNYVKTIFEDHLGIIWIGTDGGGLNRYDPSTRKFTVFKYDANNPYCLSNDGVTSIYEDSNHNLWVGTYWGLDRFDRKDEKFYWYLTSPTQADGLLNHLIWVIFEDSRGIIWLGTDGDGVSMFNPKTETFTNFAVDSSKINHISGNIVISIFETRDRMMWFGTHQGLNSYNRKTGKFTLYNRSHGLLSPIINSIEEDDKGNLWIGTDKSLSKFDRKNKRFTNYTRRNGLTDVEFSPAASIKWKDGKFFFGTNKGLIFFNPDSVKEEHNVAPVVITDLKIFNQSVPITQDGILNKSIIGVETLEIPFSSDVITFDFALLDYFNVKKNRFSYKLVGFDAKWNEVGNRNSATYTNLPPGEYTFYVKATSSDGLTNGKGTSLKLKIIPAYYQSWWFRIFASVFLFLITVLIINGRTRKIKNQNKLLEKYVTERTKDLDKTIAELSQEIDERKKIEAKVQASLEEKEVLLKEIHHRVKNNLQVISSLLYLNSKKIIDENALSMFKESQNRVKSIALVHERLYQSQDLGRIDFKDYVQRLITDLFRSYAVNQSVIKLTININNVFISIDTAVPCGLIVNELVSNSLKYAFPHYEEKNKEGLITISFNRNGNNELILEVSDNGVGISGDFELKKQQSLGLQLVDTLVSQLEGTIDNDFSSGTAYKIKFNI